MCWSITACEIKYFELHWMAKNHTSADVFGVEHGLLLPVFDDPGLGRVIEYWQEKAVFDTEDVRRRMVFCHPVKFEILYFTCGYTPAQSDSIRYNPSSLGD